MDNEEELNLNNYVHETGAIINECDEALQYIDGRIGEVDFPPQDILTYHKQRPGVIYAFAHTHPEGMTSMSERDKRLLKSWAYTMSPYPIRMIVIAKIEDGSFRINTYVAQLESKEAWELRGKPSPRHYEIIKEDSIIRRSYSINNSESESDGGWVDVLIKRTYGHQD